MSTPLLLLHGALGASTQFDPLRPLLAADFELHALDFESHGRAPLPERPLRIPHLAENVLAYMDAHAMPRANFLGHSMGGYVALYLALHHAERVGKLFTLGTKWAWTADFATAELRNLDAERMEAKIPHFAQALAQRHSDWRGTVAKVHEMTADLGHHPPLTLETMAAISIPVRIGLGDRDQMVTLEESTAVFRALPQGELQILPATPHPLERMAWPRLAAAVRDCFA